MNTYKSKAEKMIYEFPKGLLGWYEFRPGVEVLYLYGSSSSGTESKGEKFPLYALLQEKGLQTVAVEINDLPAIEGKFDYIVFSHLLEICHEPEKILNTIYPLLNSNGVLLFGMNNRLGIRYFCGDRDEFSNRNFDSIENYARINDEDLKQLSGRSYSKSEVAHMLVEAGFAHTRFYSIFPGLIEPQFLVAEDSLPEEELDVRVFPAYDHPETVFLEEAHLYGTLVKNNLLHIMANAYLVECPLGGNYANVKSVTVSMERGREHALSTIIQRDGNVVKRPVYPEGNGKAVSLRDNAIYLRSHGIQIVREEIQGTDYVMPYVKGESTISYMRRLLESDVNQLIKELDRFYGLILQSSEQVPYDEIDWDRFEPGWEEIQSRQKVDDPNKDQWKNLAQKDPNAFGVILKRGYIDLVALNSFVVDGEFVFYDQEFYYENVPARAILLRTINFIYMRHPEYRHILSREELLVRYGIAEHLKLYQRFSSYFISKLKNQKLLSEYRKKHKCDLNLLTLNRQRINYSQIEYEHLFRDIFRNTEGRDLYLFGSGNYAKKFISQFSQDYEIKGLIDNNIENWGKYVEGIEVVPPKIMESFEEGRYKIIICIRNYVPVKNQLDALNLHNYSIYDWSQTYPHKIKKQGFENEMHDKSDSKRKKYHTGYVAGVFDLFHIGHVNLLRRAKEQCDHLIVGVVTDEQVRNVKHTTPYMSFKDRIEIVRACRYVDEAVEIPKEYYTTKEAYRRYQFDVQFSGSDYVDDPGWLKNQKFLRSQGADLVFFPYTESISSTKLKSKIHESDR